MAGRQRNFLISCAFCVSCVSCIFSPCAASPLQDLASPDYQVRERATRALLTDTSRDLDDLRTLFDTAQTLEQRHRLLDVIRHHVVRQLREKDFAQGNGSAAIGFSHEIVPAHLVPHLPDLARGGAVHIIATLPGFPGHAWFQPGDLIVEVNDQRLPPDLTAETFQLLLRNWHAGQRLSFTVIRDGAPASIQLHLASIDALARMYGNDPQLDSPYLESWLAVRAQLLQLAPPVPTLRVEQ